MMELANLDKVQGIIIRLRQKENVESSKNYLIAMLEELLKKGDKEKKKKNLTKHINDRMKVIGEKLNIGKITTYVARHTYATVLRNEGVPVSIISPMLGHTSITTTEIYLADLESENRARNASLLSF